jgi:DNA-binding HxlR family transcriptional regulator
MALLDLLGRRWTLRILWELRGDALSFNDLQRRCESMSTSVLSQRLRELQSAAIAKKDADDKYRLTDEGQQLLQSLTPLNAWAERWAQRASDSNQR